MARINCFHTKRDLRIYINELIHFQILKREYVGMQSWFNYASYQEAKDKGFAGVKYVIEITTKTNLIVLEYDDKEKWLQILKAIDKHL